LTGEVTDIILIDSTGVCEVEPGAVTEPGEIEDDGVA
jgi:hypothetical protein